MKRINLADDVKISAARCVNNRLRGIANTSEHGTRWFITVTRGDKSCTFPYVRGQSLSNRDCIDTVAVFKAVMLNMAVLAVCPTGAEISSFLDIELKPHAFARLVQTQTKLKEVLGDEYDRVLNIVLENAQESANVLPV